jgi:hypothetical protein
MYPNFVKPQQDWRNGLAYMATDFEERLSERTWNWNKVRFSRLHSNVLPSNYSQKLMIEAKAFPQPATESEVSNNACQSPGLPTFPPSPVSPQISTTEDDLPFVYSPNSSFSSTFSSSVESESPPSSPVSPTAEVLFTTEIFEVRKSPKGGWGAFALVDIEKDTVVLSEAPLFRSGALQIYAEYEKLTSQQRKEYLTLACWYGVENYKVQAIFNTNR